MLLAPFAFSDLQAMKRRPACVVSSPTYNEGPDVILAMITSRRERLERPSIGDVPVAAWEEAGLLLPSTVRTGRLLVLERRLLGPQLGSLADADKAAVDGALATVLGLA